MAKLAPVLLTLNSNTMFYFHYTNQQERLCVQNIGRVSTNLLDHLLKLFFFVFLKSFVVLH